MTINGSPTSSDFRKTDWTSIPLFENGRLNPFEIQDSYSLQFEVHFLKLAECMRPWVNSCQSAPIVEMTDALSEPSLDNAVAPDSFEKQ